MFQIDEDNIDCECFHSKKNRERPDVEYKQYKCTKSIKIELKVIKSLGLF